MRTGTSKQSRNRNNRNNAQWEKSKVYIAHLRYRNNRDNQKSNRKSIPKQSERHAIGTIGSRYRTYAIPEQSQAKSEVDIKTIGTTDLETSHICNSFPKRRESNRFFENNKSDFRGNKKSSYNIDSQEFG